MPTPVLRLEINGESKIQDVFYKEEIDHVEKREHDLLINSESSPSTSGFVNALLPTISAVRRVLIEAPIDETDETTVTLKIGYDDGTTASEFEMNVEGLVILSFPESYGQYITEISFKTNSETDLEVKSKIYSL